YLPEDKQQRFQREIHQIVRQILEAADTDLALFQNLQRHYAEFMAMESLKSRILDPDAEDEESRQVRAQQAQEIIERTLRSEERRVGKECRSRWSGGREDKKRSAAQL